MAIYPTLFVLYLSRLWPALGVPWTGTLLGAGLVAACAAWNVRGARAVSGGAVLMTIALLAPFAAIVVIAPGVTVHATPASSTAQGGGVLGAMLVAMWNYMGWDNASTIAGEVERPERTYPLAMLASVALVAATYMLPVAAVASAGIDTSGWSTGSWVSAGQALGGRALGVAVVVGGIICAVGMFNALVMSYSRLPLALAEDGILPAWFTLRHPRSGAPWVAIVACSVAYTAALGLGFERLVELDVMLYGSSLVLEFVALVVLRVREPTLPRPFRVPGGLGGAVAIGVPPTALIAIALWQGRDDRMGPLGALSLGALLMAAGPILYALRRWQRARAVAVAPAE
jgi:amino acid transporter